LGGAGVDFMAEKRSGSGRKSGLSEASSHYHGHRERLRGRLREAGAEAVSDYELLELILFRVIPQRDIKPLAKTASCEAPHFQYHVSGKLAILMDDGTEFIAGPGDITSLPKGHDAWVVGDEAVVVIDWYGASNYAKRT
jgi:hypothetical protein